MTQWYYSDYERNRLGPVRAADLAQLHQSGQLQADTLVWNEGMANWRPWREVMNQALAEAEGRNLPAREAAPLSAGVNPYAMAEPVVAGAGAHVDAATMASGVNPYEMASPYAPPRAALHDNSSFVAGGQVVYAGFWKRVAAYVIDSFVLSAITWVVQMVVLAGMFGMSLGGDPSDLMGGAGLFGMLFGMLILPLAMNAVYFAWMHSSGRQATLGKMAVGIKVTDDNGHAISFAHGIGRFFASILSGLILCIGYVMAAFTDRKRALHDMVAGTLVVDQWAYTAHPERQREELGTVTVVILAIFGVLVVGYFLLIIGLVAMGVAAGQ